MHCRPFFGFLVLFCASCLSINAIAQQKNDCDPIEVKAEVVKTESSANASIILKFEKNNQSKYRVILSHGNDPWKIAESGVTEFHNLKSGLYEVYVIDKNGCNKQFNLKIN